MSAARRPNLLAFITHGQAVARDSGVIHQDVELTGIFPSSSAGILPLHSVIPVGDVHRTMASASPPAADSISAGHGGAEFFRIARRHHDTRARLRQRNRDGAPDSLRRAGYQRDSAF